MSERTTTRTPRIALVGGRGFGTVHLANLTRLGDAVELVAVADPRGAEPGTIADGVPGYPDLDAMLDAHDDLDIVIIATPIDSHAALAERAMRAGADVYLEKPPVSSLAAFERLSTVEAETGHSIQVGFQSLGSAALDAFAADTIGIGPIWAISIEGLWRRDESYWRRSPWAGKRVIDGRDVVDGVATNPLAHATATALALAGCRRRSELASIEVELLHANPIESDDTTTLRLRTADGIRIAGALTLCAPEQREPRLIVRGRDGEAILYYTRDVVVDAAGREHGFGRTDLLENLIAHRLDGEPLRSALVESGAFTEVLEAIRTAPSPREIPAEAIEWRGSEGERHPVVENIEWWVERAAAQQSSFSALRAPWAEPVADEALAELGAGGRTLARYLDGASVTETSSPRPYLHPIRSLGGVVVSDHHPRDHDWHLGLSFAIQHVDEVNFWGGRTYLSEDGYTWRPDHGRIVAESAPAGSPLRQRLFWQRPDDTTVLVEERELRWCALGDSAWSLELDVSLSPADPGAIVTLGSPGSRGRTGGGYGGFAWRVAPCTEVELRTADAAGEDAVHGTHSAWLAWSALFDGGEATIVLAPGDERTALDPWFVRVESYPGVGMSVAWEDDVPVTSAEPLVRRLRAIIADGRLSDAEVEALLENAR